MLRAWAGARVDALAILAFPAFLVNAGHGQNGFLSAALIGGGALCSTSAPLLAGLCLGALVYKPQLAVMIPIALIAARRWTTLAAAAASARRAPRRLVARLGRRGLARVPRRRAVGARKPRAQLRRRRKNAERVRGGSAAARRR